MRWLPAVVMALSLAPARPAPGPGFDARVLQPPARLGDGAAALLERTFPMLTVVPTGLGELVVSGPPGALDQAEALLRRLDRPAREVVVEVHRGAGETRTTRERRLAINSGDARVPSRFLDQRGRSRSSGVRHLRLQEGGSARLFVGSEAPVVTGGLVPSLGSVSAGRSLEVRLVRVAPGRGAQLEFQVATDDLGAATPAGPVVRREQLATSTFAPFGQLVPVGGTSGSEEQRLGGPGLRGRLELVEEERRGADGVLRPTGRFRRRPLSGTLEVGGGRQGSSGWLGLWVRVLEVEGAGEPAARPARELAS